MATHYASRRIVQVLNRLFFYYYYFFGKKKQTKKSPSRFDVTALRLFANVIIVINISRVVFTRLVFFFMVPETILHDYNMLDVLIILLLLCKPSVFFMATGNTFSPKKKQLIIDLRRQSLKSSKKNEIMT